MITIYGKANCPKCEAAKEKLKLMGMQYEFIDLMNPPEHWRETGAVDARAMYEDTVDEKPALALPLVDVPPLMTYPAAMKELNK